MRLKDILLSAFSGILLTLAFPKFNLEIIAWVALIPWLWAIRNKSLLQAVYLGLVAGLVFFTGLLYWITSCSRNTAICRARSAFSY